MFYKVARQPQTQVFLDVSCNISLDPFWVYQYQFLNPIRVYEYIEAIPQCFVHMTYDCLILSCNMAPMVYGSSDVYWYVRIFIHLVVYIPRYLIYYLLVVFIYIQHACVPCPPKSPYGFQDVSILNSSNDGCCGVPQNGHLGSEGVPRSAADPGIHPSTEGYHRIGEWCLGPTSPRWSTCCTRKDSWYTTTDTHTYRDMYYIYIYTYI